jgi:hypothetical protein
MRTLSRFAAVGAGLALAAGTAVSASARDLPRANVAAPTQHVLLLSVDGLHQSDLQWYVHQYPGSALAQLVHAGADYTHAQTPIPSDSFPGMVAQVTGGDPRTTGIYYDAEYNHDLLPPGTTKCPAGAPTGTPVTFDESIDRDSTSLDAGEGLPGLPSSILGMTGDPTTLINPAALPVDPSTCAPVYPNQYLQVNTVFNVLHDRGLLTAWSDKHPAYQILDGPEGNGIDDLFTPEINSDATGYPAGDDWTSDNAATMQYDSYKVQAVLNELQGMDHSGTQITGVPAILGMNFQTVSTAEKLPSSDGLPGGDLPGTTTPGPLLVRALNYVSAQLGSMMYEIDQQGLENTTAIILSAKHGQSPEDPDDLTRVDDGPIIAGLDKAWKQSHPDAPALIASATDDDALMMWLSKRTPTADRFVSDYLLGHSVTGNTADGGTRTLANSGLSRLYVGPAAAAYFGVSPADPRHPDVWGVVQHGVVYTGGTGKIAEHGGSNPADRDVPLIVDAPHGVTSGTYRRALETTSIAPTILRLLNLNPSALDAVKQQGTPVLPGIH